MSLTRSQIMDRVRSDSRDAWRILVFSAPRIHYAPLAIPVVLIAIVAYLVTIGAIPGKPMMMPSEAAAIGILVVALAVAWWRWRKTRAPYFLWLTWLVGDLVVREIHFTGTSPVFYIALILILYIGLIHYSRMAEYFASPTVLTLLAFVAVTYVLTQALDAHVLAFLPQEKIFERPTEELIEVVGHLGLLLLTLFSRKGTDPLDLRAA